MRTTFVNQNSENNIVEAGKRSLESISEDLRYWARFGTDTDQFLDNLPDEIPDMDLEELGAAVRHFEDTGDFYDYGLCFDFVAAGTFNDQKYGYYRYQIAYGGPSYEVRFHHDGLIEFVYLDWYSGVGFDVTGQEEFEWLKSQFEDTGSMDWDSIGYEDLVSLEYSDEEE